MEYMPTKHGKLVVSWAYRQNKHNSDSICFFQFQNKAAKLNRLEKQNSKKKLYCSLL